VFTGFEIVAPATRAFRGFWFRLFRNIFGKPEPVKKLSAFFRRRTALGTGVHFRPEIPCFAGDPATYAAVFRA
jgi:hypothetical protein